MISAILPTDRIFPERLKALAAPPAQIFARGNMTILAEPSIAIVGTRKVSREGRELTKRIAEDLARAGLVIVSGLAFGADAAAHEGALAAGGLTVAVLASGVNNITPREHLKLAERIIKNNGAIVSEYAPAESAYPGRFLERNRIIAGLALATLVTEAPFKSGALNTAAHARRLKRPVFALPGSPFSVNAQGTNKLISKGQAKLITAAKEILQALKFKPAPPVIKKSLQKPAGDARLRVLKSLENGPRDLDSLANLTKLAIVTLSETLTDLELEGYIKDVGNKTYIIRE